MEYLYTIYRNWRMKGASMTEYAIILGFVAMIAMYAFTYQINGEESFYVKLQYMFIRAWNIINKILGISA